MKNSNLHEENEHLKERVMQLEELLEKIPAILYINQIDNVEDMSSGRNVWSNLKAKEYAGYTQEEISLLGSDYFSLIMHPDDACEAERSIAYLKDKPDRLMYCGVTRIKPKNESYRWCYTQTSVLKRKSNGDPLQFVTASFILPEEYHTYKKLEDALTENNRLRNKLILQSLSKRELEVLKMISQGLCDEVIAKKLFISKYTVHTHRNKIIKKTKTTNTASLVAFAVRCGIV